MQSQGSRTLLINKEINLDELAWHHALERLVSTFKLSFLDADREVRQLITRMRRPFNLSWFLRTKLTDVDNRILLCLCEAHGTDSLLIMYERSLSLAIFNVHYQQQQQVQPGHTSQGSITTKITLSFLRLSVKVNSLLGCFLFQIAFFALAVLLYVLAMGVVIYSVSVFLIFLFQPLAVLRSAVADPTMGLALLGFIAGSIALCGRASFNLIRLAFTKLCR